MTIDKPSVIASEESVKTLNQQLQETVLLLDGLALSGETLTIKWEELKMPRWLVLLQSSGESYWGSGYLLHEALWDVTRNTRPAPRDKPADS